MRRYTLYKAAKFSKISRYKLEQAIAEGLLKTVSGKGNIKYYIEEDELNRFLEEHGDQYVQHRLGDSQNMMMLPDMANQFVPIALHEKIVAEKERIIALLEDKHSFTQRLDAIETQLKSLSQNKDKETIRVG